MTKLNSLIKAAETVLRVSHAQKCAPEVRRTTGMLIKVAMVATGIAAFAV